MASVFYFILCTLTTCLCSCTFNSVVVLFHLRPCPLTLGTVNRWKGGSQGLQPLAEGEGKWPLWWSVAPSGRGWSFGPDKEVNLAPRGGRKMSHHRAHLLG